jgi:Ca2+-binding EF-hand superfamily protein
MFLSKDLDFTNLLELFNILDSKKDGTLDETEFSQFFLGIEDSWNSHSHNIMKSILRNKTGI